MEKESLVQHLKSRHCDVNNYSVILDEENCIATFLLYNLSGKLCGYQQYRPHRLKNTSGGRQAGLNPRELRYFTKAGRKENVVFGLDVLDYTKRDLFLVEGIFDACSIHALGFNALAVLCNNPVHLKSFLQSLGYRLIAVCDGGDAGKALAKIASCSVTCPEGTDPNSMEPSKLLKLITGETS